ncbi:MAG: polysaccharide deacetylase family protein [Candidatus Hydrogenedentota bacterium]
MSRGTRLANRVFTSGCAFLTRALDKAADGIIILNYHSVGDPAAQGIFPGNALPTSLFRKEMNFVRRYCHPMSLDEVEFSLQSPSPLPRRAVAVTFDDGYKGVMDEALPILKSLGIVASVFLPTDLIAEGRDKWEDRLSAAVLTTSATSLSVEIPGQGFELCPLPDPASRHALLRRICLPLSRRPSPETEQRVDEIVRACAAPPAPRSLLSPEEVSSLARNGFLLFGSHSAGHRPLSSLDDDELRDDLQRSIRRVSEWTRKECAHFAYPFGGKDEIGPKAPEILRQSGITLALTTCEGTVRKGDDRHLLRRVLAHPDDSFSRFTLKVLGGHDAYIRAQATLRSWARS